MFDQFWHDIWIILFVLLIIIGVFAGQGLVIGLGAMGLVVAGISWVWNKLSLEEVAYTRKISQSRVFIGEDTTLAITVTNRKPLPLGRLEITDEVPEELLVADAEISPSANPRYNVMRHTTSLAWYERISWEYKVTANHRGFYRIGPARLESGDLFGFFNSEARASDNDYLLVYPQVVPLPELGIPAVRPLGETRGGIAIFQDPSRPAGIRDYQLGDPLKTVDWKLSARMQRLQVRTFEPSSSFTVVLVVVVETAERSWEGYSPTNLERVITTAASLASYVSEKQYSLGLFSNGTPILTDRPMKIPPARSPEQLTIILEALATIRPLPIGPMAPQLAQYTTQFSQGVTLVVVAALINEDMVETIDDLRRHGYKIVVVYVGDRSCPPLPDGVLVHDLQDHLEKMEMASEFGPR
ncbi:MAG: DUF58 domain-containing protein [SAR202 cluster bacterium]|nr:DUF58 domain-containing protein [SAR202 cluster bacterium]MDP6300087.1 DUF58 domain-containing protein [SAR202 cluster bacterium]MDP7225728.1 DUF58 domain-containing protein [SAR202 cluster bacterium]MDP7412285.1 DUF58 domain-containing protein [SAR202 cluster bacterium]MDP7534649.1 DUF58 domain-containing protein [SAR202 cluster bacterium]